MAHTKRQSARMLLAATMAMGLGTGTVHAASLEDLLDATALDRGYVAATPSEVERSEALFSRLLSGERGDALAGAFRPLGFVLQQVTVGGEGLAVLSEAPEARTGKGVYVVRGAGGALLPVALQTPHRFKDVGTGRISVRILAEDRRFAAAAWNTVPRWYDEPQGRVDADLAHARVSHFNAFTRAFARVHPGALIVQLHGFEADNRRTAAGGAADMVVSGTVSDPGPQVRLRADCLRGLGTWRVLLYPLETRELGGTTNKNALALRSLSGNDGAEFLHLEIAREPRRRLLSDAALRRQLTACLLGGQLR